MTDTHTPMPNRDLTCAQTHSHISGRFLYSTPRSKTHFSFTFTGAFLLHTCGVKRNWRTYFISVRRVFLVETVVFQTVLWDIRAWSARFLVISNLFMWSHTSPDGSDSSEENEIQSTVPAPSHTDPCTSSQSQAGCSGTAKEAAPSRAR